MTDTSTEVEKPQPRDFSLILIEQRKGALEADMTEAFAELLRQISATGKKGSLTLRLVVEPQGSIDDAVTITDEIKVSKPVMKQKGSIFFVDADGSATRTNPNQEQIPGMEIH